MRATKTSSNGFTVYVNYLNILRSTDHASASKHFTRADTFAANSAYGIITGYRVSPTAKQFVESA